VFLLGGDGDLYCFALRWNEKKIAELRAEQESVQYRSRTTRLAKWRELSVQAQRDLELAAAAPDRLQSLGKLQSL